MQIISFEILDHGCDGESYFPGCGVAFSKFDVAHTGIGDSAREAANDALDQIAFGEDAPFNPSVLADLEQEIAELSDAEIERDEETSDEWHHYVTIRIKFQS